MEFMTGRYGKKEVNSCTVSANLLLLCTVSLTFFQNVFEQE